MPTEVLKTKNRLIRVFIVEDYKLTRLGLYSVLQDEDQIDVVGDSEDAETGLQNIRTLKPDIVIMDVGLPGINGITATQQIKAFDKSIKVIIYTSHEKEEEVIAALGAGADAYCVKSSSPETIVSTIRSVYEGAAWLDPAIAGIVLDMFRKSSFPIVESPLDTKSREATKLTERELEVLSLVVEGKSNSEIAQELFISVHTAKEHVCNILQKLAVHDRVQAAVKAISEGIIPT